MAIKNKVQLITYPDSLGGDLKTLKLLLESQLEGIFSGGVHVLPPYPSSGDRGFAPVSYFEIEPRFGEWSDLTSLSKTHHLMLDLMVNHVSRKSEYFQDYLEKGDDSEYAGLFIPVDNVFPSGEPTRDELDKIFLRRKFPWSTYTPGALKTQKKIWTTFGKEDPSEQIDLDVHSEKTRHLIATILENFSRKEIKYVRLDAVGYVIKKPGTSCFFVEPEINEFLDWIMDTARAHNLELLPEVHAHHAVQKKLSEKGFWTYDFILPYVILETIITKSGQRFIDYLKVRPQRQFTMLDCHDGIPVKPDLDGVISSIDTRAVVNHCLRNGANLSLVYSEKHKDPDGFDVHQIRGTWYSMVDCNDDAYISSRALQFFTPGIPQVYYVGFLAGENDVEAVTITGEGREINRHNYSLAEVESALNKTVVQRLVKLIKFRNDHPAFDGSIKSMNYENDQIHISWENGEQFCRLRCNLLTNHSEVEYSDKNKTIKTTL